MTIPNICKEQSCNEKVQEGYYLCREHSGKEQTGAINECPQCGVYKDAKHPYCRECTVRLPNPALLGLGYRVPNVLQQAQQDEASSHPGIRPTETTDLPTAHERALQRAYQEMTPTQLPINPEKRQTSAPPPKPPSEASSRPKIRPDDADLPDRFIAALGELIREMKTSRAGQKRYELKEGRRTETAGDDILYRFPFTDKIEREDQVEIQVGQRRVEGTIVAIGAGHLVLALKEDIGDEVSSAILMIYETALLEALKEKIEAVNKGEISLNRTLADAVVQPGALPKKPARPIRADDGSELDDSQRTAYQTALREALTFIWGPPGCGKTMTLSAIVHSAFNSGKRTLICSNTNKAVDQVLYKICEALTHEHPSMEGGKVVRLGRIADDKLASKYGKYVAIDEIAERRSAKLAGKKSQLEKEIAQIDAYIAYMQQSKQQRDELSTEIRQIETEIAALRKGAAIDKIVERHELAEKKSQLEKEIAQIDAYIQKLKEQYATACQRFKRARQTHDDRRSAKAGEDRTSVQASIDKAKQQRDELRAEIRQIEIEIAALRKTVLRDAKIVGATCTTAYLTGEIGQFDLVIVDEASMVIRPAVWFSAGLASQRVVISGDFRQIPPIVNTEQEAIRQEIGLDSFTATERTKPDAPGLAMLTTQYRMHPEICGLISGPMYEDKLRTSPTRKKVLGRLPPNPFEKPLTIIDTSDLRPVESQNNGSRFNKLHTLLVRNFVWHLRQNGVIATNHDLGICTPYSAQARLIQKLLKEDNLDNLVHCGTVHRFQGDERRIVLLEIPESGAHRNLGQFVRGVPPDHIGARLINVAVSRAQEHFVMLANLTHLDKRLPSNSLLRSILHKMEQQGCVVSGGELDKLRPIGSGPTYLPPASPSKPPSEPPSPSKAPVEHSRSTNPPAGVIMNNAPSPFGLPLEAGPLQGIDLGDPLNVIGGILYEYRVYNPPNPHPLFDFYSVSIHDELGILKIVAFGKINKNDKYGNAVRGTFDRVIKSLDGKYGVNLRHIVNESVSGNRAGIAQTFDYLKSSSSWNRDDDFLRALADGDRELVKFYYLEGHDPLSSITVDAMASSASESYLNVRYEATSFRRIMNAAQSAQDNAAF
ncbi:MAG: AAA domain-containing protein [Gemmatimonadota bacterium]|nr:AAA domain-containing protein [Gemmatimonadota bacterium]